MLSYTGLRTLYGYLTNDSSSANLTIGDRLMNDAYRLLTSSRDWDFLQKTSTDTTVANTQFYTLPDDYDELVNVTVLNGSYLYTPRECPTRVMWDQLNTSTQYSSNFPEWFFIFNGTIGFYPIPSTTSLTITYTYRQKVVDLSVADYTTGNVTAVTSGATTVTGSATSWTSPMAGRFLQTPSGNTAGASGDNRWYKISAVGSATSITLVQPFLGATINSSTSYTIGQMPILPEPYHPLPVYKAVEIYYSSIQPEVDRAELYKKMYDEYYSRLLADYGPKTTNVSLDTGDKNLINPNLQVTL